MKDSTLTIKTTIGEAAIVITEQVREAQGMLGRIETGLLSGDFAAAYSACDFNLLKRISYNLEQFVLPNK